MSASSVTTGSRHAITASSSTRSGREVNTAGTDRELLRQGAVIQALTEAKEFVGRENAILTIATPKSPATVPATLWLLR